MDIMRAWFYFTGWMGVIVFGAVLLMLVGLWILLPTRRVRRAQRAARIQKSGLRSLPSSAFDALPDKQPIMLPVVLDKVELRAYLRAVLDLPAPDSPVTVAAPLRTAGAPVTYHISTSTLAAAYAYLLQRLPDEHNAEPEWMLAVTGLKLSAMARTLEQLVAVKLAQQSSGRASFDMSSFTAATVTMFEHGQALHGIFHSHRFNGATGPSPTDHRLMHDLEAGGYPTIQAVFSADGYVRFFGGTRPWCVSVTGTGAERLAFDLWRITERSVLPAAQVVHDD